MIKQILKELDPTKKMMTPPMGYGMGKALKNYTSLDDTGLDDTGLDDTS